MIIIDIPGRHMSLQYYDQCITHKHITYTHIIYIYIYKLIPVHFKVSPAIQAVMQATAGKF